MAEEKATAPAPTVDMTPTTGGGGNQKPTLFILLAVINMAVVASVGWMLWKGRQKEASEPKLEQVIKGEASVEPEGSAKAEGEGKEGGKKEKSFTSKTIPLETFVVNLAGAKGRRVIKVNLELELKGEGVAEEVEKRKAQIRDIIIILLSSKTYEEVSQKEGRENLRNEMKDTINSFLSKGKILNIFFTDFIYS